MATQTIGACPGCGFAGYLHDGRCSQCPAPGAYIGGRVTRLPLASIRSGLRLQARVLASAGFSTARIAELLAVEEADVRRVLDT